MGLTGAHLLLFSLVDLLIHLKNTSQSPALGQVLLHPWEAERGMCLVHKVVWEPGDEQM